ncbi:MAG: hypothetical protein Q8T09_13170 [Candidatus Melainabacteria bacterium]|nr:hypothetical protein [Candidatus Melainabacteria bacterium]
MTNHFQALRLNQTAEKSNIDLATLRLTERFSQTFKSAKANEQAQAALAAIRRAHEELTSDSAIAEQSSGDRVQFNSRLRLGQLCLATGMISLEQLKEAVQEQQNSDRQLGEILLEKQFISQEELDGLLIGQELIAPDEEVTDSLALQLIALGLVTEDLMIIALLEQRFATGSIGDTLVRRGWIEEEILAALKID